MNSLGSSTNNYLWLTALLLASISTNMSLSNKSAVTLLVDLGALPLSGFILIYDAYVFESFITDWQAYSLTL